MAAVTRKVRLYVLLCALHILCCIILFTTQKITTPVLQKQKQKQKQTSTKSASSNSATSSSLSSSSTSIPTIIKASRKTSSLPLMIIHIGPRKTATTTLQLSLHKSRPYLSQDSFVFYNRDNAAFLSQNKQSQPNEIQEFQDLLESLRLSGTNVIISDEAFSTKIINEKDFHKLQNSVQGWDIRIVVTYRRYFDWVISEYDQECARARGVNMNIQTLLEYYQHIENNNKVVPLDLILFNRWKRYFDDVYIFNMYGDQELRKQQEIISSTTITTTAATSTTTNEDHIFTRFICQAIPEAEYLCNLLKVGTHVIPSRSENALKTDDKVSAEALLITVALQKKKLFTFNEKKRYFKIAQGIDQYLSLLYDYKKDGFVQEKVKGKRKKPLSCLSQEDLDDVLIQSMTIEQNLLPNFHYQSVVNGVPLLKVLFEQAVDENNFCQLDINTFLEKEMDGLLLALPKLVVD